MWQTLYWFNPRDISKWKSADLCGKLKVTGEIARSRRSASASRAAFESYRSFLDNLSRTSNRKSVCPKGLRRRVWTRNQKVCQENQEKGEQKPCTSKFSIENNFIWRKAAELGSIFFYTGEFLWKTIAKAAFYKNLAGKSQRTNISLFFWQPNSEKTESL